MTDDEMAQAQAAQLANLDRFIKYDSEGRECTNERIEELKQQILSLYERLPSFTTYPKHMIDEWVSENAEHVQRPEVDFIAVVKIEGSIFDEHKIVIQEVEFTDSGQLAITYSVVDNDNVALDNSKAMEKVVQDIVYTLLLENILQEEIDIERDLRSNE